MIRGSTPTFYFKINNIEDLSEMQDIWVTIAPYKEIGSITKKIEDLQVDLENKVVSLYLTQEETLNIISGIAKVQIKILMNNGQVFISPIFDKPIGPVLNTTIMVPDSEDAFADRQDFKDTWAGEGTIEMMRQSDRFATYHDLLDTWDGYGTLEVIDSPPRFATLEDFNNLLWEVRDNG